MTKPRLIADSANTNSIDGVRLTDSSVPTSKLVPLSAASVTFTQNGSVFPRNVDAKLQEVVSVKDFGAKGDEVTDDTAAIQAALNWLTSYTSTESGFNRGGRALFFPAGNYRVTSTLTLDPKPQLTIYGEGAASHVRSTFNGTLLRAGNPSVGSLVNFNLRDISFSGPANTPTFSDCILLDLRRAYRPIIENCTFDRAHTCVKFSGVVHGNIKLCELRRSDNNNQGGEPRGTNLLIDGVIDGVQWGNAGIHVEDCEFFGGADSIPIDPNKIVMHNIHVRNIDGLYISNTHMYNARYGLCFEPDGVLRNFVTTVMCSNVYFDKDQGPHVAFLGKVAPAGAGVASTYQYFTFNNCYFRASYNHHVLIEPDPDNGKAIENILFSGCQFTTCNSTSIIVPTTVPPSAVAAYKIKDCVFDRCSATGSGAFAVSDGVGKAIIQNNAFEVNGGSTAPNATSMLAIYMVEGSTPIISGNSYLVPPEAVSANYIPIRIAYSTLVDTSLIEDTGLFNPGYVQDQRSYVRTFNAGQTRDIFAYSVPEGFVGLCRYSIVGNDSSSAPDGFHANTGYFSFRRLAGGSTQIFNVTQEFNSTFGTMGSNSISVAANASNFVVNATNNSSVPCEYTAKVEILMKFVQTS